MNRDGRGRQRKGRTVKERVERNKTGKGRMERKGRKKREGRRVKERERGKRVKKGGKGGERENRNGTVEGGWEGRKGTK